jgi:hypothetical protein
MDRRVLLFVGFQDPKAGNAERESPRGTFRRSVPSGSCDVEAAFSRLYPERAAESKIDVVRFKIIPGDWGKVRSGWLIWLLTNRSASFGEAEFTGSSGGVRTPSNANEGLGSKPR